VKLYRTTKGLFVEANHDPELLRRHPNPASRYHLSNPQAAKLICHARKSSKSAPQTVILGHLSRERNTEDLARFLRWLDEIYDFFTTEIGGRCTTWRDVHAAITGVTASRPTAAASAS
jgi:hypothetical protein